MEKKKSICIISFSPIYRDARVLRQIKYLSPHYDLTVIGYGQPRPDWTNKPNLKWFNVDSAKRPLIGTDYFKKRDGLKIFSAKKLTKYFRLMLRPKTMAEYLVMFSGRIHPSFYDVWFWGKRQHKTAFKYAVESNCDIILANDWNALPVAAEVVKRNHAKLIFDAHEYAPLELENRRYWRILYQPAIVYFLKKYISQIDASLTVAPIISRRYEREFVLNPIVVLNAPEKETLPDKVLDINHIRMIHHGGAIRDRRLERMIETVALCDRRFSLDFMLLDTDRSYLNHLRRLAKKVAPDRIRFLEPVPPEKIVQMISAYDMGIYLLEPNSYNSKVALPNKFFDFIVAGLAVCIGPSPSMAEMVNRYGFGCVAPSFEPRDIANMLNKLTEDRLFKMRFASEEASKQLNAEIEMGKLLELFVNVLK